MAMLAEPRRKQKVINLRAKNNAWSNDNTKFGQRMLEKMGWKSGKGLGVHENGITEHVVARYKNDEKGLGFEDKNDQWTKHEDDFNALLANLSNASNSTDNLHSGISLEDKSKKSKARIHYHKFTRGKDISRYSEKDLANIFGKKSLKATEQVQAPLNEDLKTTEQIFTEKGSMEDYFKIKLADFKSKSKLKGSNTVQDNEPGFGFCGFSQETSDTELCNGFGYNQEKQMDEKSNVIYDLENLKKKKKMDKSCTDLDIVSNHSNNAQLDQQSFLQNEETIKEKSKKKKSKNKIQHVGYEGDINGSQEFSEEKIKKKRVKYLDNIEEQTILIQSNSCSDIFIPNDRNEVPVVKNKKKSNKSIKDLSQNTQLNGDKLIEPELIKKKNSKCKTMCEDTDDKKKKFKDHNGTENNSEVNYTPQKKRKEK